MRALTALFLAAFTASGAEFTTYIGDANDYRVVRAAADSAGNTYLAGNRSDDCFVMKLDATGKITQFTAFSGKGSDSITDLALDSAGNLYVAGATSSANFPLHNALQSTPGPGFLIKFNPDATQMIFSTYFPAGVAAIAVDSVGGVYLTGSTTSSSFPVTAGLPASQVGLNTVPIVSGAYLTKIAADGSKIVYSTVIAGHGKDCGAGSSCFLSTRSTYGVAVGVDSAGNAYFAGDTDTNDMPTTSGAFLRSGTGAWVGKVNAAGTAMSYLTMIGSTNYVLTPFNNPANLATGLAVDAAGNAYLVGQTSDPRFPATAGAYRTTFNGPSTPPLYPPPPTDAFVAKLNPAGSALVWATFAGGSALDRAQAVAVDASGGVWVTGMTQSPDFPNQQGWSQDTDFAIGLSADGSKLPYSARYPAGSVLQTISVDGAGTLHVAGASGLVSTIVPAQTATMRIWAVGNGAWGPAGGRIAPSEVLSLYGPHIGPTPGVSAVPDASGALPRSLAGVQVLLNDLAVPLLYVSDAQINAVMPNTVSGPFSQAQLKVVVNSTTSAAFTVTTLATDPQVFQNADGSAKAVNVDGSVNDAAHPARAGSVVSVWATGTGALLDFSSEGHIATAAQDFHCCQVVSANAPLNVLYGGAAPGIVTAVTQINFQVPAQAPSGARFSFNIAAGGRSSNPVFLYVQP